MTMYSDTSTIYDVAKTKLLTDAQLEHAKTTLFRFAGIGVLIAMVGAGIGMACFGYSYINDGRAQAQKMADVIVQAFNLAKPIVKGEVKLADGSVVHLAPGGQVAIAPGSVVRADQSSTGSVIRPGNGNGRSTTVVPSSETTPSPQNRIVTQYTTFKTVTFGKGHVVTGWNFDSSNQVNPARQYCYYDEPNNDQTHIRTNLGQNGTLLEDLETRAGVDLTAAFGNCIWFSGAL